MAKLFIVPKKSVDCEQPQEIESAFEPFQVSGDPAADLELALRAISFLLEWVDDVGGATGLLDCAEKVRQFRKEVHE